MRVLQVAASVAPQDGGPTTALLGLNRGLNSIGVRAIVVATDAAGPKQRLNADQVRALDESGARIIICRRARPFRLKNSWGQVRFLWREAAKADVIHIHGVYLAHTVWASLAARRYRRPYTVQPDGALEPYQRRFGRTHKRAWDLMIGRRIIRNCGAIIAASTSEATNLREYLPGAQIAVVPLGVTVTRPQLTPAQWSLFQQWLSVPREQRVLFLGRLARKKRPDLLVTAWNQTSSPSQLAIVGPPQDWCAAQLRDLVDANRQSALTIADTVDSAGVAWLMTRAGIFVLPSENENFGISVAEGMAYGCCVITTEQTAASEHVSAAGAGIVLEKPCSAALTLALNSCLQDPQLTAARGRQAARYAARSLTWAHSAALLRGQHEKVLDEPRGTQSQTALVRSDAGDRHEPYATRPTK